VGLHEPYDKGSDFPRIDEEGTCWLPQDYEFSSDEEQNNPDLWRSYTDPESQIKRAECTSWSFEDICADQLYWNTTACPERERKESSGGSGGDAPAEER